VSVRRFLLYVILVPVAMPVHLVAAAQTQDSHPQPLAGAQPEQPPLSRTEVIDIIAATRKIVSPNGIEELLSVPINGSIQSLSIRGRDRRNPILLFLHGGPGSPTMPVAYTFQSPWEDYFTVVQWDQRGTGKTYAANDPKRLASSITIEEMTSDAEEVVRYLLKQYGKRRVFLLGHSWGSVLGVALAQRHPEWFYAYLGVGQIVNAQTNEEDGYRFTLDQARANHNDEAEKELSAIAPYPGGPGLLTFERIGVQRKWLMYYGGLTYGRTNFSYDGNAWILSPDYTQKDLDLVDEGSLYSLTHLLPQLETLNYEPVTNFKCPVFLFEGRHDYAASHTLASQWFEHLRAPSKELIWFDNSAHMVMQEEPGRFLYHLIADVRPLAADVGDVAPEGELLHSK
jgi:proline iminopeptidase